MAGPIQSPVKGQPMRASWGAAVSSAVNSLLPMGSDGLLARQGVAGTGFSPLPANLRDRKAAAALHPWKVFAFAQSEDVDHCFEIHVPEAMVHVGEYEIEVEGLTAVEDKTDRYTLDCEDEIDEHTVIHLAIVRQTSQSSWSATVIATLDDLEDYDEVLAVLPLAMLTVDSSGESPVGKVDAQYAHSSVTFSEGGEEILPDGVSVENKEISIGEDEEGEDIYGIRRQIKGFDTSEPLENYTLAKRLSQESDYPARALVRILDDDGRPMLAYIPLGSGLSDEKYTKGDYTNIEFTPVAQGSHTYKVDVFYS